MGTLLPKSCISQSESSEVCRQADFGEFHLAACTMPSVTSWEDILPCREVQRILMELLNQMDGFDQNVNVKVGLCSIFAVSARSTRTCYSPVLRSHPRGALLLCSQNQPGNTPHRSKNSG